MRRTVPLVLLLGLSGCVGFDEFLSHTFSPPGVNPNIPMADSENLRRVLGQNPEISPLEPEPGNVWPGLPGPDPTLADIQNRPPQQEDNRGFPPTDVPGATPGLPAGRQPRPRGSSTPPGSVQPGLRELPNPAPLAVPRPRATTPPLPGGVLPLPNGPATDTGGTSSYRQLNTPRGPGAIVVPNGNGSSTVINPDGSVQTIPELLAETGPASMLKLLYFASLRERMGTPEEDLPLPAGIDTVASLIVHLKSRDAPGAAAFANPSLVRAAVNHEFSPANAPVRDGDEIAFFPPGHWRLMASVRVQPECFDAGAELARLLAGRTDIGGIGAFVGVVRGDSGPNPLTALTLEHYPAMTEKALAAIAAQAEARWDLLGCTVIHRYGRLEPGDPIVLVLAASTHRKSALAATAFLIDWLKTRAPFWKSEERQDGSAQWVEAREADDAAAARWEQAT